MLDYAGDLVGFTLDGLDWAGLSCRFLFVGLEIHLVGDFAGLDFCLGWRLGRVGWGWFVDLVSLAGLGQILVGNGEFIGLKDLAGLVIWLG